MTEAEARQRIVFEAVQCLGWPYVWGHPGPQYVDCSGLYDWILGNRLGIERIPDLWTGHIWQSWERISRPENVLPGDAVLYGDDEDPSHVVMALTPGAEIVLGANGGRSFRGVGIPADYWSELSKDQRAAYLTKMHSRGAMVRVEYQGYGYRRDILGFRRVPL